MIFYYTIYLLIIQVLATYTRFQQICFHVFCWNKTGTESPQKNLELLFLCQISKTEETFYSLSMYLFVLGRNVPLSLAELKPYGDPVFCDEELSLLLLEQPKIPNPRELPKIPEQVLLDRLGGTIRIAEVIGEYFETEKLLTAIKSQILASRKEGYTFSLGLTGYELSTRAVSAWAQELKQYFQDQDQKIRLVNPDGEPLTSGRIFQDKVLKKGTEFIIWRNKNSFLLAKTAANQNLRNYELRDRKKAFRDAKMGMLPPKLAQILVNLATEGSEDGSVIDPFCGSATINIEAGLMGYKTFGSDLNPEFVEKAEENFRQMAEKFRYDPETGTFAASNVLGLDWGSQEGVVATEGWLGENFVESPDSRQIDENKQTILKLWEDIFKSIKDAPITRLAFCLPAWNYKGKKISISEEVLRAAVGAGFTVQPLSEKNETLFYERDKTFVAREICVVAR